MIEFNSAAQTTHNLAIDGGPLSISQVYEVARGLQTIRVSDDPSIRERMDAAHALVARAVEENWQVYGVTTGFGGMSDVAVPKNYAAASQNNLLSFLATSAGNPIDRRHVRAAMALRANVLLQGRSGVRLQIVQRIAKFLEADAIPVVRELGSIGASGDLVPLTSIARAVTGKFPHTKVSYQGRETDSSTVVEELGFEPIELQPKEGLAIVNGTSFSAAVASNCVHEARALLGLTLATNAMMLRALCVQDDPFHPYVQECKPHPGQIWTAKMMRRLLKNGTHDHAADSTHVQDRYSLRCLPQYYGPTVEGLSQVAKTVTTEMNSVSDNPIIDTQEQVFYQGGNFLGQYLGVAMDDLRRHLGLLAKHLDVQIAQLVSPEFSRGLPASLRGNDSKAYNMGLKGLQITGNSIMPMLTYHGNPLVEHYPTHAEQYNQNINGLSWGASCLAWRSVELFQHYMSVALVFAVQALDLRAKLVCGHYDGSALIGHSTQPLYRAVCESIGIAPGPEKPLVYDDADQSLECYLELLHGNLVAHGSLIEAIKPLIASFEEDLPGV